MGINSRDPTLRDSKLQENMEKVFSAISGVCAGTHSFQSLEQ